MTTEEQLAILRSTADECVLWARHGLTGYPSFSFQSLNAIKDNCESTLSIAGGRVMDDAILYLLEAETTLPSAMRQLLDAYYANTASLEEHIELLSEANARIRELEAAVQRHEIRLARYE